jgi:formylglycine-generating enzyme
VPQSASARVLDAVRERDVRVIRTGGVVAAVLALGCDGTVAATPQADAPRSCAIHAPGANDQCGAANDTDCCASTVLPGGTYNRENKRAYPATVSPFSLDVFELTNGRFRAFVDDYPASRPAPGDGAHPNIDGSGWDSSWDAQLPATQAELMSQASCVSAPDSQWLTWTDAAGAHEYMPASCVSWYVAFAFCAWDGGRLPTDAEWNFAAVGGTEQRTFPWGEEPPDPSRAVLRYTVPTPLVPVGSAPAGAGKWGQMDLAGSRWEWVLDDIGNGSVYGDGDPPVPCNDCAELRPDWTAVRVLRGDQFLAADPTAQNVAANMAARASDGPEDIDAAIGVRCARDGAP